jgi:hypothetical protein
MFFLKICSQKRFIFCNLYFNKECKNIDEISSDLGDIYKFLERESFFDEIKRIEVFVKGIIFPSINISPRWYRSGNIIIPWDSIYHDRFLIILGILVWYSYCLEYYHKNKSLSYGKITEKSFEQVLSFFAKIDRDTNSTEQLLRQVLLQIVY